MAARCASRAGSGRGSRGPRAASATSPSYPDSGGELTDGAYGTASYGDAAWQGRNAGAGYSITVDLGAQKTVKELRSDWLQTKSVYIFLPKKVTYEVSADGSSYTAAGSVAAPADGGADQARTYRLLGLNATARYVRITVEPAGSAWSFTDEVEVRTT
ncbi:discoidin domain-containing protein [Nonomuraea angiospora]|uniref:discoidin domain-containing protein n=1 Tax=Nonomuraea angiospora TaxID=46172 RepID=UPI0037B02E3A